MRVSISGSHGVGKSTLMGAFLAERSDYIEEPEAFEVLADSIALLPSEGPDLEGLDDLLEHTVSAMLGYPSGASAIFERCPLDYLAYARASESIDASERERFIGRSLPNVRQALLHLDLIVLLPVVGSPIEARPGDNVEFRGRVDEVLHGLLVDDDEGLFVDFGSPQVVELSSSPNLQLRQLLDLTSV